MKSLLFAIFILNSISAFAWEKVASCDYDMFVIDRQVNASGRYDYQAVFRGNIAQAMLNQNVITTSHLNKNGELVTKVTPHQSGVEASGTIAWTLGFMFSNQYHPSKNFSIVLHSRGSILGNYVFNSCAFKYGRIL